MPRSWLYILALLLAAIAAASIFDTRVFLEWLWYNGYEDYFNILNEISVQSPWVNIFGGWPFPLFVFTVICFWIQEQTPSSITFQFLVLPIAFIPFLIVARAVGAWYIDNDTLYAYPMAIILAGYAYLLPWALLTWFLSAMGLVE